MAAAATCLPLLCPCHPDKITILEIYADERAYQSHIETPHFLKYKQGTLKMVKELELVDSEALIPALNIK